MSEQVSLPQENYYITSGPLRSSITIELHTHIATRTWTGRLADPEKNLRAIIGMPRLLSILNIIRMDSVVDNPYADMWMLRLEERLLAAREDMDALISDTKTVFSQLPEMMTVEGCLSVAPARFPVFASTQLGFIAIYLLTDYDSLMRNALLANHMALLSRTELDALNDRGGNLIRSILVLTQRYRRIPVTRQDIRESNARSRAALEQGGEVPEDIFDGTRRSAYAPPLRPAPDDATAVAPEVTEPEPVPETLPLPAPAAGVDEAAPDDLPDTETEAEDDDESESAI
ncbi:TIGR03761 family integrating conjugative element protein [Escherichia coli]|nr:TIGR03761 family integrating conjugative element protein [Escherichia coli]QMD80296.1 TIGR03761 family integrating conjugative element protein [Escherichia coli]QML59290.1 TIGR03761 family integrating conjugative element protein [Escherichia coli]HDX3229560.1 TIGR03761 family integrating conjugative element protein [Escherichia coli]